MSPDKTDRRPPRQIRAERIGEAIALVLIAGVAAACSSWLF
jgi:hypothetical protein